MRRVNRRNKKFNGMDNRLWQKNMCENHIECGFEKIEEKNYSSAIEEFDEFFKIINHEDFLKHDGYLKEKRSANCGKIIALYFSNRLSDSYQLIKEISSSSFIDIVGHSNNRNLIGKIQHEMGNFEIAVREYKNVLEKYPNDKETLGLLGEALIELKEFHEAKDSLDKALKMDPDNYKYWNYKGFAYQSLKMNQEALTCYNSAIKIKPQYDKALSNKGTVLNRLKQYNEALKLLEQSISLSPHIAESWKQKGISLTGLKRFNESLPCFDEAIRLDCNLGTAFSSKSLTLLIMVKPDDAIKSINEALRLQPESSTAWACKGLCCKSQANYTEALDCFERALTAKEFEDKETALLGKAETLALLGRQDAAVACFDLALEASGNSVDCWVAKGNCLLRCLMRDKAMDCFNAALKRESKCVDAWLGKADCYRYSNDFEAAVYFYGQVVEMDQDCKEAYMHLASIFVKTGDIVKAIENLDEILELDAADYSALELRADLFFDLEEFELAIKDYELALKNNFDNEMLIQKKLNARKLLLRKKEVFGFSSTFNETISRDLFLRNQILTEGIKNEIENNDFLTLNNKNNNFNNTINLENDFNFLDQKSTMGKNEKFLPFNELKKEISRYNKLKSNIFLFNKTEIITEEEKQEYDEIVSNIREIEVEAIQINTTIDNQNDLSGNKISIDRYKEFRDRIGFLEGMFFKINKKNEKNTHRINLFDKKFNILKSKINEIEREIDFSLKDHEKMILRSYENLPKKNYSAIEDYIFGLKNAIMNVYVCSQVLETGKLQINHSDIPISLVSFGASLIPVFGSTIKTAINTVWEFINERKVKRQSRKILALSNDSIDFSQKIGIMLQKIFENDFIRDEIFKFDEKNINLKSENFFAQIKNYFNKIAEDIKNKLYTNLYNTPLKKLGFLHANFIIEGIYDDKLLLDENFNFNLLQIIESDLKKK